MFEVWVRSILSVAVVSALSLVGVFTMLLSKELNRGILLSLVSFSVGGLFGGAFFHLIPEASKASGFTGQVSLYVMMGILGSFVMEGVFKWRHCHVLTSDDHPHSFGYMNLFGDSVHNLIDGLTISGAYLVSATTGLAATLAICLHELPQEIGDFGVLLYAGLDRRRALAYNFITALTAFVGAFMALMLSAYIDDLTAFLVPFAAGNFIYIAGSDLIPELHSEPRLSRTLFQIAVMALGVALLFSIRFVFADFA